MKTALKDFWPRNLNSEDTFYKRAPINCNNRVRCAGGDGW